MRTIDVITEARLNQLARDIQKEFDNLRYLIRTGQILWKCEDRKNTGRGYE